jgi:hypothetical protein
MEEVENRLQISLKNILLAPAAESHLERATAHKVVAHALCPVLTVRERRFN